MESIKATDTKLVLAALQHAPRGLESEKSRKKNPLTSCLKNVTNRPSQKANIDVEFKDIFPFEDSPPILLAVQPAPTLPFSPSAAVSNRRNLAKPAQPMIPCPHPILRPTTILSLPWLSPHPIPNPPCPPMPH